MCLDMRRCFLCGQQAPSKVSFQFWADYRFALNWCETCELGWVPELPSDAVFADAYERLNGLSWKDKTPDSLAKDIKRAYLKGVRIAGKFLSLKGASSAKARKNWRVLEVGSNIGVVLKGVKDKLGLADEQVVGIDFSKNHAEISQRKFQITTIVNTLAKAAPGLEGQFDLILCHHIIEHDADPAQFLEQLRSLLKPGGIISFELPNGYREMLAYRTQEKQGYAPFTLVNHINYFSPAGFRRFLQHHRFNVLHLCSLNANNLLKDHGWGVLRPRQFSFQKAPKLSEVPNISVENVFDEEAIQNGIQAAQVPAKLIGFTHALRLHYPDATPWGGDIEAYVTASA